VFPSTGSKSGALPFPRPGPQESGFRCVGPHPRCRHDCGRLFHRPDSDVPWLYAFFVLSRERRRVIHVNVTEHPTTQWAGQQIVQAVGPDARTTDPRPRQDLRRRVRPPRRAPNRAALSLAERMRGEMGGHRTSGDRRPVVARYPLRSLILHGSGRHRGRGADRMVRADSRVTRGARSAKVGTMRELLVAIVGATLAALRPRASLSPRTSRCASSSPSCGAERHGLGHARSTARSGWCFRGSGRAGPTRSQS
jgi:hypothetical protein